MIAMPSNANPKPQSLHGHSIASTSDRLPSRPPPAVPTQPFSMPKARSLSTPKGAHSALTHPRLLRVKPQRASSRKQKTTGAFTGRIRFNHLFQHSNQHYLRRIHSQPSSYSQGSLLYAHHTTRIYQCRSNRIE